MAEDAPLHALGGDQPTQRPTGLYVNHCGDPAAIKVDRVAPGAADFEQPPITVDEPCVPVGVENRCMIQNVPPGFYRVTLSHGSTRGWVGLDGYGWVGVDCRADCPTDLEVHALGDCPKQGTVRVFAEDTLWAEADWQHGVPLDLPPMPCGARRVLASSLGCSAEMFLGDTRQAVVSVVRERTVHVRVTPEDPTARSTVFASGSGGVRVETISPSNFVFTTSRAGNFGIVGAPGHSTAALFLEDATLEGGELVLDVLLLKLRAVQVVCSVDGGPCPPTTKISSSPPYGRPSYHPYNCPGAGAGRWECHSADAHTITASSETGTVTRVPVPAGADEVHVDMDPGAMFACFDLQGRSGCQVTTEAATVPVLTGQRVPLLDTGSPQIVSIRCPEDSWYDLVEPSIEPVCTTPRFQPFGSACADAPTACGLRPSRPRWGPDGLPTRLTPCTGELPAGVYDVYCEEQRRGQVEVVSDQTVDVAMSASGMPE